MIRANRNLVYAIILLLCCTVTLNAQDFGRKGLWEVGGLVMYANNTLVVDGETEFNDESISVNFFFINVPVYYMVIDGWQIGIVPEYVSAGLSSGDADATISLFGGFFSTAYVFKTGGSVYPFIEGRIGYNSINVSTTGDPGIGIGADTDETLSGICWGFSGGIKVQLGKAALLNIGVGYQQRTTDPDNPEDLGFPADYDLGRTGLNAIVVMAGFSVFLGK